MILPYFLVYTGSLLAGSVGFFAIAKRLSGRFASSGSRPTIYGVVSALVAAGSTFLADFVVNNLFVMFWVLSGIYLLFGMLHVAIARKKFFKSTKDSRKKQLLAEVVFGMALVLFTIIIFSCLEYFLADKKDYLFMPMMFSAIAFFLPIIIYHSFGASAEIPMPEFQTWEYPLYQAIELPPEDPSEILLVIAFSLAKKVDENKRTTFRAKAPMNMKLGDLFYHFINDYNELNSETTIAVANSLNEPFHWLFRTKPKLLGVSRVLNPRLSNRDNGIKENSVIVAERVLDI